MNDLVIQLIEDAHSDNFELVKIKYMTAAAALIIESHRTELFNTMRELAKEGRTNAVTNLYEIRGYALGLIP